MFRLALVLSVAIASSAAAGITGVAADLPPRLADQSERLVASTLVHPRTANFRKIGGFWLSDGGWAVCGEVNYRNATGLAVGWKPIYLRFRPENDGLKMVRRIIDWPADVACRHLAIGRPLRTRD